MVSNLVFCTFTDGDVIDGWEKEELVGTEITNEHDCGILVQQERPRASGATYYQKDNKCWAEYGTSIHKGDIYRACIFLGNIYNGTFMYKR